MTGKPLLLGTIALAAFIAASACSGSDDSSGTTGSGGAASGDGGGTGDGTGGSSEAGGATASGGDTGTGGETAAAEKLCATKTTLVSGTITGWEDYDGSTPAGEWSFPFNGTAEDANAVWAGPYGYDDETGTPFFGMVAGNSSNYAVSISNPQASAWGGGFGLWMGCVDASSFTGIQFYARGSTVSGTANLTLTMEETSEPDETDPAAGGTCVKTDPESDTECSGPTYDFAVADAWTLIQVPWTSFTAGTAAAGVSVVPTGDGVAGFSFNVGLNWVEDSANPGTWIPEPGSYELDIDDLAFY